MALKKSELYSSLWQFRDVLIGGMRGLLGALDRLNDTKRDIKRDAITFKTRFAD